MSELDKTGNVRVP